MTAALLRPPEWTKAAACINHPLGHAAFDNGTPQARAVCARCPVRHACALDALGEALPDTMRGGLTPDDRRAIAARYGFDRPGLPRHGDRARYVHRDHPCRCDLCREAHRRWAAGRRAVGAWAPDTTGRRMTA